MATKEDQKNEIPESGENQENPENPEEEVEEPVDEELQKEMKGLKIEDADFTSEPKTKKHNKKSKNPEEKKGKKKGQDFLDFANKNNIEINIEYESKYQQKKNDNQKYGNGNNRFNDNKKPYNKGGYKNDKTHPQKKQQQKFTGNKFDTFGQRPPHQNYQNYHQSPKLTENKEILEYLEKIFGEQNLNKDTYIRNRLKDGKITLDDVVAYNDIKNNNIKADKILEIIKDSQNLECINEDNKNYIKIKNFDKLNLLKLEEIIAKKKAGRMNRNHYAQMMAPQPFPFGYNYINMQNNYYFYNKYPPYNYQTGGYIPVQENK
jgi:hypothetical protein